jgi:hypothetical protein
MIHREAKATDTSLEMNNKEKRKTSLGHMTVLREIIISKKKKGTAQHSVPPHPQSRGIFQWRRRDECVPI